MSRQLTKKEEIKRDAEEDLYTFAVLTNPARRYGDIHRLVFKLLENDLLPFLLLLPRSHMKSHCIAVWVAWHIVKNPWTSVMYVSSTDKLAIQQVYAIKLILESDVVRRYWPELVHPDEAKREKWAATEVKVDHPLRKERGVRDATLMVGSAGMSTTGLHCDVLVYDDIVAPENAYTEGGRQEVAGAIALFDSILNPGGIKKACGTRYHPKDAYGVWLDVEVEDFDDAGNSLGVKKMWTSYSATVHDADNKFLWPREYCPKLKQWYGFDLRELAKIRATYFSMGFRDRYYSQYFNDPNKKGENDDSLTFTYYARERLVHEDGKWLWQGKPLAIFLGGDFAYTKNQGSDYTAYAVLGVTWDNWKLLLDLDQFKTDKYEEYFQHLFALQQKWGFKRGKVEVNSGANVIAGYVKDRLREENIPLVLDVKNQSINKQERTAMILTPEYTLKRVLHYRGGWMSEYEDQLIQLRPAHDDMRDAVTIATEIAKPPVNHERVKTSSKVVQAASRFGGRR